MVKPKSMDTIIVPPKFPQSLLSISDEQKHPENYGSQIQEQESSATYTESEGEEEPNKQQVHFLILSKSYFTVTRFSIIILPTEQGIFHLAQSQLRI